MSVSFAPLYSKSARSAIALASSSVANSTKMLPRKSLLVVCRRKRIDRALPTVLKYAKSASIVASFANGLANTNRLSNSSTIALRYAITPSSVARSGVSPFTSIDFRRTRVPSAHASTTSLPSSALATRSTFFASSFPPYAAKKSRILEKDAMSAIGTPPSCPSRTARDTSSSKNASRGRFESPR